MDLLQTKSEDSPAIPAGETSCCCGDVSKIYWQMAEKTGITFYARYADSEKYQCVKNTMPLFGAGEAQVFHFFTDMLFIDTQDPKNYFSYLINAEDKWVFLRANEELFQKRCAACDVRFRRSDGSYVWCKVSRCLMAGEKEDRELIIGSLQDVTARHREENSHILAEYIRSLGLVYEEIIELNYAYRSIRMLMTRRKDTSGINLQLQLADAVDYLINRYVIQDDRDRMLQFFREDHIHKLFDEKVLPQIEFRRLSPEGKPEKSLISLIQVDPGQLLCCISSSERSQSEMEPPDSAVHNTERLEKELSSLILADCFFAIGFDLVTEKRIRTKYDVLPDKTEESITLPVLLEYIRSSIDDQASREIMKYCENTEELSRITKAKRSMQTMECRLCQTAFAGIPAGWIQINFCYYWNYFSEHMNIYIYARDIDRKKNEEIRQFEETQTDPVTGLMNRKSFMHACQSFFRGLSQKNQQRGLSSLLIIELDDIKRINDQYGHAFGDKLLRHVADTLRLVSHKTDMIAHFAGGEFTMCIREVSGRDALKEYVGILSNALRYQLNPNEILVPYIGITVCPLDGKDFETLYEKASDAAAYARHRKTVLAFYAEKAEPENETEVKKLPAAVKPAPSAIPAQEPGAARVCIRTFGYFDVFVGEKAVAFKQAKTKELLALLVDRRGGYITAREAISYLWENEEADKVTLSRCRKVFMHLKQTLAEYGIEDIVESRNGERRIVPEKVDCDLFAYLSGEERYRKYFKGTYLLNYSWGETTLANLLFQGSQEP